MDKKSFKDVMKIVAVLAVGTILSKTFFPPESKTNYAYLQELITDKAFEKTAEKLVDQFKSQNPGLDEQRLLQTKAIISECLKSQAQSYLTSGDPYLQASANKETPTVLASRFMNACNLL
jgi:hypothetical protein